MRILTGTLAGAMMFCGVAMMADDIVDHMVSTPEMVKKWSNSGAMTFLPEGGPEGENAVKITATDPAKPVMCGFNLDIAKVRGKTIKLSADVKGENISVPEKPYLGIKMMIVITKADDTKTYPDVVRLTGSFDWRKLKNTVTIPVDAKAVHVQIGLQGSSGTIYFADVEVDEED